MDLHIKNNVYLLILFVLVSTSFKDATCSGARPIGHDMSFSIQVCFGLVFWSIIKRMQLGITCSFDVQEWWWNPPKTSPALLQIFMYTSTTQCVVEVTSSPRTLLPWGFGFSACFVWNPRCMANVVEGALFCAGASCFFCWGVDYRLALSHLFSAPRCLQLWLLEVATASN